MKYKINKQVKGCGLLLLSFDQPLIRNFCEFFYKPI